MVLQGSADAQQVADFKGGLNASFIDADYDASEAGRAHLVCNGSSLSENLLSVVKRELSKCESFDFAVAFVTDSGLACLVDILDELKRRGARGRILTSTYLNFNNPVALRKLQEYGNIETRVYQGSLHTKGYLFERAGVNTVIVGSSNLTQTALTCNKEWNVLFRSFNKGAILASVKSEFDVLWNAPETVLLTKEWIDGYEEYRASNTLATSNRQGQESYVLGCAVEDRLFDGKIKPNKMQASALEALSVLHGRQEPRALLISATGTGKTYLSAFEVLQVKPRRVLFLAHRKRILAASMESYRRVLGSAYTYGLYNPATQNDGTCLFAMCSTIVNHLEEFDPDAFDYIVVDEAHRVGAQGYQRILSHFTPKFCLGMTATPDRTDGFDVFSLFNHVIAFQITLQDALENEMLVPFHYYGIADLQIDYESTDNYELFSRLTSRERVRHIIDKIEAYTVNKDNRRGLVFCNRNDEARSLSDQFNELGYRTMALSGANTDAERDEAIDRLETGEIQYIFTVDIFNEGIDIPSVNQIIMLRRTESAIVFVQQLGRGLRKCEDKEYALVLDFIGNYQKNFFVPVALSGDKTYNKDRLRNIVQQGSSVIPGASTVSFDRISESRIYHAIDCGKFSGKRFVREEYTNLRQMLGRIPALLDFDHNGTIDPLLIFKAYGSYHALLSQCESDYEVHFSEQQEAVLAFLSQKLASGKRSEELLMLERLLADGSVTTSALLDEANVSRGIVSSEQKLESAQAVLYGNFARFRGCMPLVIGMDGEYRLTDEFKSALKDEEFRRQVNELVEFGLHRYYAAYGKPYKNTNLVLYAKYTYEEVCRLLGWDKNVNGQNIGGYKYDKKTNTFPVFINYDKAPDISDSIKYEDRFLSDRELIGISKNPRDLTSPEIKRLQQWPENGMKTYLFMRKNKDDEGSKEFYFFGEMYPTGAFKPTVMAESGKKVVEITYRLDVPVRHDLYEFMTSDLTEDEPAE